MDDTPDDDYKLPCDVHVPPNTFIRKGCRLSTLLTALRAREEWSDEDTTFPQIARDHLKAPSPSKPKVDIRKLVASLADNPPPA